MNTLKELAYWAWVLALWAIVIWVAVQGYQFVEGLV